MKKPPKPEIPEEGIRLNKYVAHAGIASRRAAADIIKKGMIKVNGETVVDIGYRVMPGSTVTYKGKAVVPKKEHVYILMNKPKDCITTASDEKGRRTVLDLLRGKVKERVYPVGRLDRNTTGLLLITDDGELAQKLTHPKYEIKKIYHVILNKPLKKEDLESMTAGLTLEDGDVTFDNVDYAEGKSKREVMIELHSGRNRIIRRVFEHLGYEVEKLDRVYFAGLTKKDLPRGRFRFLTKQEVIMIKHFT